MNKDETTRCDCSSLTNSDISGKSTPNDKYENFVTTHVEAASEWKQTKSTAKCQIPWFNSS